MRRLITTSRGNLREICQQTDLRVSHDRRILNRLRYRSLEIGQIQHYFCGGHGNVKRWNNRKSYCHLRNSLNPILYKNTVNDKIAATLQLKCLEVASHEHFKSISYYSTSTSKVSKNLKSINNTLNISKKDDDSNKSKQKMGQKLKMMKRLKKKQLREKAKKLEKIMNNGNWTPAIPMQTENGAEFLFDCLAPHLDVKTFDALVDSIHWFCELGSYSELLFLANNDIDIKNKDANINMENFLEIELDDSPLERLQVFFSSCEIIEDNPWIKPLLSSFLLGESSVVFEEYKEKKELLSKELVESHFDFKTRQSIIKYKKRIDHIIDVMNKNDKTFKPDQNGLQFKKNVQTLMKAREKSAEKPPKWGSKKVSKQSPIQLHSTKSESQKRKEAEDMAWALANRLPQSSCDRLLEMLQIYGCDNSNDNISIHSVTEDKSETSAEQQSTNKKKRPRQALKNLFPRVKQKIHTHVPLIISELAYFLYVDVPNDIDGDDTSLYQEEVNEETDKINLDKRLDSAWGKWNKMRVSQSESLKVAQHHFAVFDIEKEKEEIKKRSIEVSLEPKQKDEIKSNDNSNDQNMIEKQDTVSKKKSIKHKKGYHAIFDAIQLEQNDTNRANDDDNSPLSVKLHQESNMSENKVFLINLPIDVTPEELKECYSRCGPISSVKIFNLRPDLDPGRRSLQQRKVITKKERLNMKEIPKCTPIYALIEFATNEGYQIATNINLIIFGMVIRRHTVKTVPAEKITSLFIENIPSGYFSLDLEYKFNKVLQPHIYVCLDTVEGIQGGSIGHEYKETKSSMIQFPNFELALFAYDKLQSIDIFEESKIINQLEIENGKHEKCTLQWIKTPSNAMEFWTREINFE